MRFIIISLFAAVVLPGCVTDEKIMLPNGAQGYHISCEVDGVITTGADCYKKAQQLCPKGYDVVDSSSTANTSGSMYNGSGSFGTTVIEQMVISCH